MSEENLLIVCFSIDEAKNREVNLTKENINTLRDQEVTKSFSVMNLSTQVQLQDDQIFLGA